METRDIILNAIERRQNHEGRRALDDRSSDWVINTMWLGIGILTGIFSTLYFLLAH